jgi:hypothetical protein
MDPARDGPERKRSEEGRPPSPPIPLPLTTPISTPLPPAGSRFAACYFGGAGGKPPSLDAGEGGKSPSLDAGEGGESGGEPTASAGCWLDSFVFDERSVGEVIGGMTAGGGEAKEASDNSGSPARAPARTMPRAPGRPRSNRAPRNTSAARYSGGAGGKSPSLDAGEGGESGGEPTASDNSGSPARAPARTMPRAPGRPRSNRAPRNTSGSRFAGKPSWLIRGGAWGTDDPPHISDKDMSDGGAGAGATQGAWGAGEAGTALRASGTPTALGASPGARGAGAKNQRPRRKRPVCPHGKALDKRRPCARCAAGAGPQKVPTLSWTVEEHRRFTDAFATFGRGHWVEIADAVRTRTAEQCRTHSVRAPSCYLSLSALFTFALALSSPPFILSHSLSPPLPTHPPPQQKVNPGSSTATHDTTRRARQCRRCRLHGVEVAIKGHRCPRVACTCAGCIKLEARRVAVARAAARRTPGKKRKRGRG